MWPTSDLIIITDIVTLQPKLQQLAASDRVEYGDVFSVNARPRKEFSGADVCVIIIPPARSNYNIITDINTDNLFIRMSLRTC